MGRRHAVWGFVSIERRPGRRRSEIGSEDFLVKHDDKSAGMSGRLPVLSTQVAVPQFGPLQVNW